MMVVANIYIIILNMCSIYFIQLYRKKNFRKCVLSIGMRRKVSNFLGKF